MMKPVLKFKGTVPYGGQFVLNLPDRGMIGMGTNFDMLLTNLKKYRRANAIPVGLDFENEVEREVCAAYPAECRETSALIPDRERRYSFEDVIQGTKAMIAFKVAGSPLVDQAEANRRAAICSKCPNNVSFVLPCGGSCGELNEIVKAIVGGKSTPSDAQLRSCAICSCQLASSVWVELSVQWNVLSEERKSQFRTARDQIGCWKVGD